MIINFVYDYCMNIPELTEVGLAMSHASVLLLSVCSFTSEAIQLDFTSHPLCLGQKGVWIPIQGTPASV